jgi:hypothetical protein
MNDWLGTAFRPFSDARAFAHSLGLKCQDEWRTYCKSGKKPDNIPAAPYKVYRKSGWIDWDDWLGTRQVAAPRPQEPATAV